MKVVATDIPGVVVLEPHVIGDVRGYFYESWSEQEFTAKVAEAHFVQDNVSSSCYGVVRGLHYQRMPHAQRKLVRVTHGRVLDVAVDIRRGSPTFGKHVAVELSADNHRQLFIPRGFAHGFAVLSEHAVVQYKCDDYYVSDCEGGIAWNDPALAIDWRLPAEAIILSEKDRMHPALADAPVDFFRGA